MKSLLYIGLALYTSIITLQCFANTNLCVLIAHLS